jgi:tetratricopeptide (TPR) repeat protein
MTPTRRALVAVALVAAFASAARAQPRAMAPDARAELDRGLAAYAEHDWEQAVAAFRAGYAIDPHPDFLFPWAQATRLAGDCAGALPLYRRAQEAASSKEDRADIERLIARCEEDVERDRPPAPEVPEPTPPAPRREVAPDGGEVTARSSSPWYTDRLGGALALGAAFGLATGAGFIVAAKRADRDADAAETLDEFVGAADLADRRRLAGAITLATGAALAAAATFRYAWVAHHDPREPSLALAPTAAGGAVVSFSAAF